MPKRPYAITFGSGYPPNKVARRSYGYPAKASRGYNRRAGFYGRFKSRYGRRGGKYGRRRSVKAEKKYKDFTVDFGDAVIPATGATPESIVLLSAGNTPSTMVGRKIVLRSIQIRGYCKLEPASNATLASVPNSDLVRIMLVRDKMTNGAQAAVTDVLLTNTEGTRSMLNMENGNRFKVVKEWLIEMNDTVGHNGTANVYYNGRQTVAINWYKKCFQPIQYDNAPSSAVTDLKDYNYFLMAISEAANCTLEMNCRIRYDDV